MPTSQKSGFDSAAAPNAERPGAAVGTAPKANDCRTNDSGQGVKTVYPLSVPVGRAV